MEVRRRHHLRSDEISRIRARIESMFGVVITGDTFEAVEFAGDDRKIILIDGEPMVLRLPEDDVLTVRAANEWGIEERVVTVDAGAVSFVSDGADIMRPGIVDADETIDAGDPVVIVEETHGKALAIGYARTTGADMLGEQGKVVDTIHYVGDDLYGFSG